MTRYQTLYVTLAACALVARAQDPEAGHNTPHAKDVILNVAALDAKGQPVTDLTSADFQIFDDGKLQQIASFKSRTAQPAAATAPPSTVILFDLLNSIPRHRDYISKLIIRALQPLETADSVYLYILTNHGDLYPVHALPTPQRARDNELNGKPAGTPWTRQIHPLLDRAIQSVYGLRPVDDKDQGVRSLTTFHILSDLGEQLTEVPGPNTIVWITGGVETGFRTPTGAGMSVSRRGQEVMWLANATVTARNLEEASASISRPSLHHFSAELDRTGTVLYSVEDTAEGSLPPVDRGTAKDTLQQLADLTGGRMYTNGEVDKAIAQSQEDARARYQIAYDAPPTNGKYHKLRVACTRKGVRIQAQRGYFADQP